LFDKEGALWLDGQLAVSAGASRLFESLPSASCFYYGSRSRGGRCFTEAPPELQVWRGKK